MAGISIYPNIIVWRYVNTGNRSAGKPAAVTNGKFRHSTLRSTLQFERSFLRQAAKCMAVAKKQLCPISAILGHKTGGRKPSVAHAFI